MKLPRRTFLHLAAGAAAFPAVSGVAGAQAYPSRPVRWVVGFPPGGSTDMVARIIAPWLSERLGQQIIIENKPGAGTNLAAQAVINSPPDGYTLLFVTAANAINATLYEALPFDLLRDIAPVGALVRVPLVMEVNPDMQISRIRLSDKTSRLCFRVQRLLQSLNTCGVDRLPNLQGAMLETG